MMLPFPRFLNLVHRAWLSTLKPEQHAELNAELIGPLTKVNSTESSVDQTVEDDPFAVPGMKEPAWWTGDLDASRTALAAGIAARR